MLENFIQLDADTQHRIETFGELGMSFESCTYYAPSRDICLHTKRTSDNCMPDICPLLTAPVQYSPEKTREEQRQSIEETLRQRGNTYGEFDSHARITQSIKRAMSLSPNWDHISDDKKECLEMVAHKIGRILNGNPEYKDSWHDIIGYVKLVDDTLEEPK